jgi:class 3 adenylate cyclase
MATLTVRGFERPDEVRTFEKGRLEIIHLGDLALGRLIQEPGWHWAEHVGPITGTKSCQSHHLGFVISGRAHVVMDDGSETDLVPGAAIEIPPGHDAWVVGDEPHVTLEFSGVRSWARAPDWTDEAIVSTILVTDIVGSTQTAERLGDSAWRELLSEHHGDVRRVLERFGGTEVKTTGDGVLAMFPSAVRAVQAGLAIRDDSTGRGLSIRTGLHTGEVARSVDDVRGLAVHVAARVMALAEPDEVLVSATTHDLAEAAEVTYRDRGSHVLKGVSGTRQVFSVEPIAP